MKKILLVLLTIISVILLGACASSDDTLDSRVSELENVIEVQQTQIDALQDELDGLALLFEILEERFNNVVSTVGINRQVDYYENQSTSPLSDMAYETLIKEEDVLDKSKFPDYIWDIDTGEYVSINDLTKLLVAKYFNGTNAVGSTGYQYRTTFTLNDEDMSNEEFVARLSMMVIELSNYDFYTIDTSQLYYYIYFNNQTVELQARMSLLVTDKYELSPVIFYEELLDTKISGISYDSLIVETYCNDYITNETFIGYVLNYK